MILADDNFATIVDAIRIGRCTYANLMKIITFVLPTNGGQAFSVIFALIIDVEVPITALQILWVNMVTSVTLGLVLAFDKPGDELLSTRPRARGKQIFGRFLTWRFIYCSVLLTAAVLGIFHWEQTQGRIQSIHKLRTVAVNCLSVCQMTYLFNCRNLRDNEVNLYNLLCGNSMIYVGIFAVAVCQVLFTYTPGFQYIFETEPIDGISWSKCVLFAVSVFAMIELEKLLAKLKGNRLIMLL
jgi:magnesium-transporting ATPase (P-type)